jgi:hypothetical protein
VPFVVAVTVSVSVLVTFAVVIVTVPVVAPAAIVAVAGPVTKVLLEVSGIDKPPTGAAELIVNVPMVLTDP